MSGLTSLVLDPLSPSPHPHQIPVIQSNVWWWCVPRNITWELKYTNSWPGPRPAEWESQVVGPSLHTWRKKVFWALLMSRWSWEALALGPGRRGWPAVPVNSPAREVPIYRSFAVLNSLWKEWCWSWSSSALATWCKEPTHWKRPWCWERLKVGGEGDDRGGDGWMASLTPWTWVWAGSRSWWWTGKPGVLQSMGSQRVEHIKMPEQQQ